MTSLSVGLIGTGYMGKCHALAWTAVHAVFGDGPTIRLAHLSEATDELAATRAAEFGRGTPARTRVATSGNFPGAMPTA